MMKILIIIPKYTLSIAPGYKYTFPLGLAYISSVLKSAGYSVDCLNMNHYSGTPSGLLNNKLDEIKYDIVCVGGNAFDYLLLETIIGTVKAHPTSPRVILGGPIITTEPELIYNALQPDVGVIGEGEETILELVRAIQGEMPLNIVQGIIYANEGLLVTTPPRKEGGDLDKLPMPDFEGFEYQDKLEHMYNNDSIELTFSTVNPRAYPILSSRACPFSCTFCYHAGKYRIRSLKNVMDEIRYAVNKFHISVLLIYDDCFSSNKPRLFEFCAEIKKLRSEISWDLVWSCQLIVNTVDEEILATMKDSGCCLVSYGFESYSPIVLKSMKKHITPQQIDYAFKSTLLNKMAVQANFIFGDVAETKETAATTLDYWKNNCEGQIFMTFIQPYPGSQIYNYCVNKGLIKDKLHFIKNELKQFSANMTEQMSENEFSHLKNKVRHLTDKYLIYVIPRAIKETDIENVYSCHVTCPFCRKSNEYSHCKINNINNFGFHAICRNCFKRYYVASKLQYIVLKRLSFMVPLYLYIKRFVQLLLMRQ